MIQKKKKNEVLNYKYYFGTQCLMPRQPSSTARFLSGLTEAVSSCK